MKLTFYAMHQGDVKLRAASPTRSWMDETSEAFAYRCLPLNIANAHGWEFLAPASFSARWNGGGEPGSIDIRCAAPPHLRPTSIFGHGVLTFHIPGVFRSEPGWNLMVGGSPNRPKDGVFPLSGVIETDWSPYSFTMNWRFTRTDHWIGFDEGEPFCFVFPVRRGALESIEPEIRDIADAPDLQRDYELWGRERRNFSDRLMVKGSTEARMRWQKRYYRGLDMRDRPAIPDHQAKLRLAEFADRRTDVPAPAAERAPLPTFFNTVVTFSRIKHAQLGLRRDDYAFAAATPLIPLAAVEFAEAARDYPIAFSETDPPRPLCVVGALPEVNLQVDATGRWRSGRYIPAAARRFPFITLANRANPDVLTLGIEQPCRLLDAAAPDKLIADGEMTALCRERLAFAAKLAAEFEKTEALCNALPALDLLMPMRNVAPPRLAVRSIIRDLRVVDPERLHSLPENLRAAWRATGWLAALEAQTASARNWPNLLAQEDATPVQA